jgi:hypothetical protein
MDVSLGEEEVVRGLGVEVRDPVDVPDYLDPALQSCHHQLPSSLGEGAPNQKETQTGHRHPEHQEYHEYALQPPHEA